MNVFAKIEKTIPNELSSFNQFADSLDENSIALTLTDEVLIVDLYSNTVRSLKYHVHVSLQSPGTEIPANGKIVQS